MTSEEKMQTSNLPIIFSVILLGVSITLYFLIHASQVVGNTLEGKILLEYYPFIVMFLSTISILLCFNYIRSERNKFKQYFANKEEKDLKINRILAQIAVNDYSLLDSLDENDKTRQTLKLMHDQFSAIAQESQKRNWQAEGVVLFSDILRKHYTIESLAPDFIRNLAKYLNCEQGCIFIIDELKTDERIAIAGYFVSDEVKPVMTDILNGQGLVGQVIKESQTVILTEVPTNYIKISSGLGESTPNNVILVPVIFESKILGVIELATFMSFSQTDITFIEEIASKMAVTVFNLKTIEKTNQLLEASQKLTLDLQEREQSLLNSNAIIKRTQQDLLESQNQIANILQNVVDVIFQLKQLENGSFIFSFLSDKIEALVGEKSSKIIADFKIFSNFIQDIQSFQSALRQSAKNQELLNWEGKIFIEQTYEIKWIKINAIGAYNEVREFIWNGIISDITQQKQNEEAIRIRERAMTSSSAGIVISDLFDDDQPIIYVNPAFEAITGYTFEEVVGKNCRFLQGDSDNKQELDILRDSIQAGRECRVLLKNHKKNGELFYNDLSLSPVKNEKGIITHYVGFQNDVTDSIKAQEEIKLMNETLEVRVASRTLELTSALDELKSAQNRVVQSEKLASLGQLIAGVAHEINTPLAAIKAGAENMSEFLPQAISILPHLLLSLTEDNRTLFINMVEESMKNTEELNTREERALSKTFEGILNNAGIPNAKEIAKKLVTNGIRRDIERYIPLLFLENAKEIITTAYHLAQMKTNLNVISQAAAKTRKTVYALKSYSHFQQEDKVDVIDLVDNLEIILTLYHNQLKQGVVVERVFNKVNSILGFSDELGQVWTNLIHNAAQAMKYSGILTITVGNFDEKFAVVKIKDNGPGIPPEIKERIFEPFFTTKPQGEGTGLGLDIVRKIIEKHSGKIEVQSEPGCTEFTVYLPFEASNLINTEPIITN